MLTNIQVYVKIEGYARHDDYRRLLELTQDNSYEQIDIKVLKAKINKRKEITRVIKFQ